MSKRLAELLVRDKVISAQDFAEADTAVRGGVKSYVRFLIDKKYVSETKLLYYLSKKFGLPSINLSKFEIPKEVLAKVPVDLAKKAQSIPIQAKPGTIVVAICDPTNLAPLEDLKFRLKSNIEPVLTSFSAFDTAMDRHYGGVAYVGAAIESFKRETLRSESEAKAAGTASTALPTSSEIHILDVDDVDTDAPVVTLVNGILSEAIRSGASDIHVEAYEKRCRVRIRVDGILHEVATIPVEMKRAVVSRFKVMSKMDIAESRQPQDGRIKLKYGAKEIDFRVNTLPALFGEKVVLRLLSMGNLQLDLTRLGFEKEQLDLFKKGIYSTNGMVLVTGPTGSGKTTTLYSALLELNKITDNLSTVEDPVEYNLDGVNQIQVQKEINLTFANVLRSLLRQDPDTILVGEIRDQETAEVSIQAALTGHLVLSTLHTNDAPATITRLINMGVEPFLVIASLNTVVAQRLLRMVCPSCKVPRTASKERLQKVGCPPELIDSFTSFAGQGCNTCNKTGYKGRIAIYEVMDFGSELKEALIKGASSLDLKQMAMKLGMQTLRTAALKKAALGVTTLEEALSMTMEN